MWFILALGTALTQAAKDVLIKKITLGDGLVLCCAFCWMSTAMLLAALAATGVPEIKPGFWLALGSSAAINSVALTLYFTAIRASDLSLTAPMLTFTPLFMLATSPVIVGEYPTPWAAQASYALWRARTCSISRRGDTAFGDRSRRWSVSAAPGSCCSSPSYGV